MELALSQMHDSCEIPWTVSHVLISPLISSPLARSLVNMALLALNTDVTGINCGQRYTTLSWLLDTRV